MILPPCWHSSAPLHTQTHMTPLSLSFPCHIEAQPDGQTQGCDSTKYDRHSADISKCVAHHLHIAGATYAYMTECLPEE